MVRASFFPRLLGLLLLTTAALHAQRSGDTYDWAPSNEASTMGVSIGVKAGGVFTTPRGTFPSLLVGDSPRGSGAIAAPYAQSGLGMRYGLDVLIPFTESLGIDAEFGSLTSSARYDASPTTIATRFDLQTLVASLSLEGNLYTGTRSFKGTGLRSVYLNGGVEMGLTTIANRVESEAFTDTVGAGAAAVGSFENNDPFRHLVAFRGGVGMRFAFSNHFELQAEASYAYALNQVFSSDAIRNNDFSFDNLSMMLGVGYRF